MVNIIFFVRHFSERGTEVSTYDYAKFNEDILKNKSYIVSVSETYAKSLNWLYTKASYNKFKNRFGELFEIDKLEDVTHLIDKYSIDFFYEQSYGAYDNVFQFSNTDIWKNCKTIRHAVFDTRFPPDADFYCAISNSLNTKYNTNVFVLPYMVDLPLEENKADLRTELNIPKNALVFGRHGGLETFDIDYVCEVIDNITNEHEYNNIYFLFMNTAKRIKEKKNVIYLDLNTSLEYKVKFINTCDAMIHARYGGETFGLSCGEFALKNKNIISCHSPIDNAHIDILQDKIILYKDKETLTDILLNFDKYKKDMTENGYKSYTPQKVMNIFSEMLDKIEKTVHHQHDFIFLKGFDSLNNDIKCVGKKSIAELKQICNNDPKCLGFNTLGFMKSKINLDNLQPSKYFLDNDDGLYIDLTKLAKLNN